MLLWTREPCTFTCVTCEMPIRGIPVFHVGLPFCCEGCVANGPCGCSYDDPTAEFVAETAQVTPVAAAADLTSRIAAQAFADPAFADWTRGQWPFGEPVPTPVEPPAPSHPILVPTLC